MKIYGQPDPDDTAYKLLMEYVGDKDILYILHHQRIPVDARPCKLPLSLRVQAVLLNGEVITAMQPEPGKPARIQT